MQRDEIACRFCAAFRQVSGPFSGSGSDVAGAVRHLPSRPWFAPAFIAPVSPAVLLNDGSVLICRGSILVGGFLSANRDRKRQCHQQCTSHKMGGSMLLVE
jgi:hypothetical protein